MGVVIHDLAPIRARGQSMFPTLDGDIAAAVEVTSRHYDVGDIVAFIDRQGTLVAHRVIALEHDFAWTRGDGAPWPDPPIPREAIIGRIIRGGLSGRLIARIPAFALVIRLAEWRDLASLPALIAKSLWRGYRRSLPR